MKEIDNHSENEFVQLNYVISGDMPLSNREEKQTLLFCVHSQFF